MKNLLNLLSEKESEWIDFKKQFHANNAELLHDILCLCNSLYDDDKYIVYGVSNDKSINSVQSDENKKTTADINDFLRQINLNKIPKVEIITLNHEGHEIAFLCISDTTQKPYFITKDFRKGKEIVRAGVVYTRLKDTNIPRNESAPEDHIEKMWKERFGLLSQY